MNDTCFIHHVHLKIFEANVGTDIPVNINFLSPIKTRILQLIPISWSGWCSLRFEILGCVTGKIFNIFILQTDLFHFISLFLMRIRSQVIAFS